MIAAALHPMNTVLQELLILLWEYWPITLMVLSVWFLARWLLRRSTD
jgi:hypothetical protein